MKLKVWNCKGTIKNTQKPIEFSVQANTVGEATHLAIQLADNICNVTEDKSAKAKLTCPTFIENPDLSSLKKLCNKYVLYCEGDDYCEDNDYPHYIFEKAIKTFYGENIWKYLNSLHD